MSTLVRMASFRRSNKKRRCRRVVSFTKEVFVLDAIREGNLHQVEELFASDGEDEAIDVNAQLLGGKTPLHHAVLAMREDVVRLLLKHGAKPDLTDDSGYTPLHRAIESGDVNVARSLVELGANPRLRTPNNCLPLDLAMDRCDSEMMEVIVLGMSKSNSASLLSLPDSALEDGDAESEAMDSELDADTRSTRSAGSQLFTPCRGQPILGDSASQNLDSASLGGSSVSSFDCNISTYRDFPDTASSQSLPFSPETDNDLLCEFPAEKTQRPASMFELRAGRALTPLPPDRGVTTDDDYDGAESSECQGQDDFVFQVPDIHNLPPPPRNSSLKRNVRERGSFRKRVSSMVNAAASVVSLSSASESDGGSTTSGYSSWTLPLRRTKDSQTSLSGFGNEVKPQATQADEDSFGLGRNRFPSFRRRKKSKGVVAVLEQPKLTNGRPTPVISQPMGLQHLSTGLTGLHLQAGYQITFPVTAL